MLEFRKSSRSGGTDAGGQCVEVATAPGAAHVRDSKDVSGPVLAFTSTDWRAFTAASKAGTFDL